MSARHRTAAIVPAAGKGERLGAGIAKALHTVGAQSLLELAVRGLAELEDIDVIVVAAPPQHIDDVLQALAFLADVDEATPAHRGDFRAPDGATISIDEPGVRRLPGLIVVEGGATRQQSVAEALAVLPDDIEYVLVHDAARALTPTAVGRRVLASLIDGASAVVPGIAVTDTMKAVEDNAVMRTIDRSTLRVVQTPQGFTRAALERAHQVAQEQGVDDTSDDAGLCESAGIAVRVVDGDPLAFKITRPLDLVLAEAILGRRA